MIPRFGAPARKDKHYTLRHGAYALLPRDGKLLITCQMTDIADLQLPGGGIDPGESPIAALHREVFEETGWSICAPRRLGAFRRFVYMPEYDLWAEKLCHIYVARPVRSLGPPQEDNHQALWTTPDAAIDTLGNDGDRYFVTTYFDRLF